MDCLSTGIPVRLTCVSGAEPKMVVEPMVLWMTSVVVTETVDIMVLVIVSITTGRAFASPLTVDRSVVWAPPTTVVMVAIETLAESVEEVVMTE